MTDRSINKNMPRTEEQYEEIRESRRNMIMETALELFAASGYHNTSISMIAGKAGISKGLLYNYFEGKEELLNAILDKGIQELMLFFDPNKDGIITEDELRYYIDELFVILRERREYWRLYFAIALQPLVFEKVYNKAADLTRVYLGMIIRYFREKGFDDPETEGILFHMLLDGISLNYIMGPDEFPIEKVKNLLYNKYLNCKNK